MRLSRRGFLGSIASTTMAAGIARSAESEREVPWLAEVQTPPEQIPANVPTLRPILVDGAGQPITTREGWERRRAELRQAWREYLGTVKAERRPPALKVLEEDRPAGCVRQLVQYESEPGLPVEGYLLRPEKLDRPVPGVLVLHQTTTATIREPAGLAGPAEQHLALRLARDGFVTFSPRCFLWQGEGKYLEHVARFQARHPGAKGMAKMLWDAVRGLDVLETVAGVERNRLGAVGHSLGGKESLYLAAFDDRIKATVSSEGGIGIGYSNWDAEWYLGKGVRGPGFEREHHELLAMVAPRAFLLLGGDSADGARSWPFITAALPVYRLYGTPGRLGLFNHRKGHTIPPIADRRLTEWLDAYL